MSPKHFLTILASSMLIAATPAAARELAAAKADYEAAEASLTPHTDGYSIDDDPRSPELLRRVWSESAAYAVVFLDGHPDATAAELVAALQALSPRQRVSAVALEPRTYLVAAGVDEIGTAFILRAQGEHYRVAWTIGEAAAHPQASFELLAAWSAEAAALKCRTDGDGTPARPCGPLTGEIGALPREREGTIRFYLAGTYAQEMGATLGAQLSLWRWNGETANPLFADGYEYMLDQAQGIRVDGDLLHIGVKDRFRSFSACGSCEGRQMLWSIQLGLDGIQDLGRFTLVPDLDLIDTLFDRLLANQPATELATPEAVAALQHKIEQMRQEDTLDPDPPALGMLMGWKVSVELGRERACFITDATATLIFTIDSSAGNPRVLSVEDRGGQDCPQ
ncbi:MAG TPA: hypothetical protein VEC75_12990 [Stellaceae bacterium]|nr:hypothetical protein [Stellaceae bacterium]